jgi:hypothetical protein
MLGQLPPFFVVANLMLFAIAANVVSLDLRGAMQEASGVVAPPFPNLGEFTPAAMMGDCIHPNYAGYSAVLDRAPEAGRATGGS